MKGLRCLVTGAASGIGRAACRALAQNGARVVGLDLEAGAGSVESVAADIRDEAAVRRAVGEAVDLMGGIDSLVNAAGIHRESPLAAFDLDALDLMLAVNVRGTALVAREALEFMGEGGTIINVASELAYLGRAGASGYCATKGAILSLTRSWARELAPRIRVNAVAPGPIDTPLLNFEAMSETEKALETANPMGRIGRAEEVTGAIVFLASPASAFMTGQCVSVDGGATMH